MASVFVLAGTLTIPVVSIIGEAWGMRWGLTVMVPVFLVAGLVMSSARRPHLPRHHAGLDRGRRSQRGAHARQQGRAKLLLVKGLNVSYGDVQVLFDVDLEVDEGEVIALLGTNGAGKSTLLQAICGLTPATKGAVIFDGRDITYAPPHEIAAAASCWCRAVAHVPVADRRREPAGRGLDRPARQEAPARRGRTGARHVPGAARRVPRAGREPVGRAAADARRSAWRSSRARAW